MARTDRTLDPLWAKAPLVLLRFPRLLIALAFGAFLLCVVVAVEPLYISAEASRLVNRKIAEPAVTRYGAGLFFQLQVTPAQGQVCTVFGCAGSFPQGSGPAVPLAEIGREFSDRTRGVLGSVVRTELGPELNASSPENPGTAVALFAGTGALDHVHALQSGSGSGVWIADITATALGISPRDWIALSYQGGSLVRVRVAGIYRALVNEPASGYWQAWYHDIYPRCADCPTPPPFALVDAASMDRLSTRLGIDSATDGWQAPVPDGPPLSFDRARSIAAMVSRFEQDAGVPRSVFACCRSYFVGNHVLTAQIASAMPFVVRSVEIGTASLQSSTRVLQAAGVLVALIVMAAAGTLAMTARRVEEQLLFSRGVHPVAVAAKSSLEALIPAAVGGALGFGISFALVRLLLPDGPLPDAVIGKALIRAGVAAVAALAVIGTVSAVAFVRSSSYPSRHLPSLARVPWELALIALAAFTLHQLQTGGAFVRDVALQVRRPSVYVLLFPVFAIAGVGTLLARAFQVGVARLRGPSERFGSWAYLTVRRLGAGTRVTIVLVAASALCLGVFVQAQATVHSLQTTVDAKAHLFVGSDVQAQVQYDTPLPRRFPLPLTRVTLVTHPGTLSPGREDFDLLAVDPATFSSAAFWNPALSSVSLPDILQRLSRPTDGRVPIAIAGDQVVAPTGLDIEGMVVPVSIVARPTAFPGMAARIPLVIVDADTLLRYPGLPNPLSTAAGASTQFWVKGATSRAVSALAALRYGPDVVLTADQIKDIPEIAFVLQSFLAMRLLGVAAALLVIIGTLMYLAARHRSQTVSYGLSLRMGMSHADHRRSIVAELVAMLCSGYAIGLGLALAATAVLVPELDPLTSIPPGPIFVIPARTMAITFAALLAASWLGGWLTNRRARAVDLGEVMRIAE